MFFQFHSDSYRKAAERRDQDDMDANASESAAVYLANSQQPLRSGSKRVRKMAESQQPQQSQQLQSQLKKLKQRPSTPQDFFGSDLSDSEDMEVEDTTTVIEEGPKTKPPDRNDLCKIIRFSSKQQSATCELVFTF